MMDMNVHVFRRTAKWWNCWAMQSIKLVSDFLPNNPTDADADEPRYRSFYILFSYALELMLKSALIAKSNITENQLIEDYRHNIGKILKKLESLNELKNIGIATFEYDGKEYIYIIKTTQDKSFIVHDFTNIRYYPKQNKTKNDSPSVIKETAETMLDISEKIMELWKGV